MQPVSYTHLVEGKAAKCTEDGVIEHWHCVSSGKNYSDREETKELNTVSIPASGHDWNAWKTVTAPTSTEKGLEERTCKNCDAKETRDIPAAGIIPVPPTTPVDPPIIDDPDVPLGPDPGIDDPIIDDPDVPLSPGTDLPKDDHLNGDYSEKADPDQPKTGDHAPLAAMTNRPLQRF